MLWWKVGQRVVTEKGDPGTVQELESNGDIKVVKLDDGGYWYRPRVVTKGRSKCQPAIN